MTELITEDPDPENLGAAMLALTEHQRRFVMGWMQAAGEISNADVAAAAGYSRSSDAHKVTASKLLRNPKVQAAIKEEAEKHFGSVMAIKAMLRLGSLVDSKDEKIAASAADSVLDRTGYSRRTQQDIRVEKVDSRSNEELLRIIEAFKPKALPVIDTTAEDV